MWDLYMAEASAERSERAAATVANPGPLGLSAFALTTFVLSAANANLIAAPNIVLGPALGFFLLGWTIFTALMFLGTLRTNMATIVVFGLLTLTFLLLALGALAGSSGLTVLGGWLGILTALAAWYTALAGIMSSGKGMFNLPVGPRS